MINADKAPDFNAMCQEMIKSFLGQNGWDEVTPVLLVEEPSIRKYYRLRRGERTVVFLDSSHPKAQQDILENVISYGRILNEIGLRAPQVYAADLENGFVLMEDFGDDVYSKIFDTGEDMEPYLTHATDALIHLHQNLDPSAMPTLGDATGYFISENPHFTNWYWPARNNYETPPDIAAEYLGLWKKLFVELPPVIQTMCMTDYHASNIMDLKDGEGIRSVGIIDIQNSILTSPVYDVMTLLEDDRRDLGDAIGLKLRKRYRDAMKDMIDPEVFDIYYAYHSAQRHARTMGNFVRLAVQSKSPRWLTYVPVTTKWFDRALHSHEYLAPMQKWFAKNCPDYNEPLKDVRFFL